ncbi:putative bifunctional diguanylate cyclase/phosphodiesterase [Campylobacter concisus]|jgi:putative pas:ggdef|uniref:putative bifunctional diguanylate cyclase/phosphodiesterase n=2 Tax=Campylobacter concisus TaxID=199 RepID=UPI001F452F58|nr:EAL domain-containing protein [Campylobacter concisus]
MTGIRKWILLLVVALFILAQLSSLLNYNMAEKAFILISFFVVTFGIYISMDRVKTKMIHWLAICFGVFLWSVCDALRVMNQDVLSRDHTSYAYLDVFFMIPMIAILAGVSIFLYSKFADSKEKLAIVTDSVSVFLLIGILVYGAIEKIDILLMIQDESNIVLISILAINFLILFVTLSELFTSNLLRIRISGFYLIAASILFTMLNLFIFYNQISNTDFSFEMDYLYLVPFGLLMIGAFHLKKENKYVMSDDKGISMGSKWLPLIAVLPLLVHGNFASFSTLITLFVLVVNALVNYYIKSSLASKKILDYEKNLHKEMEKSMHERTNELMLANLRLQDISEKDYLTDIGNRNFIANELDKICKRIHSKEEIAIYYIDISHFKNINTSYGHEMGDKILKLVAKRILEVCNRQETIARISADEFIVLARMELNSHTKRMNLGIALKDAIEKPIELERYHFSIKCAIGIHVVTKENVASPRSIIKNADMAMYYAKKNPTLNPMMYSDKISKETHLSSSIELALKKSNLQEDYHIYFQPIFDIKNSKMVCAEALLRWQSQEYGLMDARDFMSIASLNSEILGDICTLAVSKTIEQAVMWKSSGLTIPKISINVAQIQSTSDKFVNDFMIALHSHHLNPKQFELEFSEEIWKNNEDTLDKIFTILKKNGVDVCIDDFGSGYTSFVYIRKYGINRIKIASEFVTQALNSKIDAQIVAAIINLARSMKIKVSAKGVERSEDIEFLKRLECNEMQGYFLSYPMSTANFEDFIKQNPHMVADI